MEKWNKSVAVITGANYGNGFATLKKLAESGITVVGLDIVTDAIETLKKEKNLKVHAIKCDVTKDDQTETAFKWVEQTLGGVDILINNAGIISNLQEVLNSLNTNNVHQQGTMEFCSTQNQWKKFLKLLI
jgi:NADP+-dependent farnesol dehydrogenase